MTLNRFYVWSKYPYFISYRGKWVYLFYRRCMFTKNSVLLFFLRPYLNQIPEIGKLLNLCYVTPKTNESLLFFWQNSPFFQRYDLDLKEAILGDGSFSVCRRCVDRLSGKEFAVKIVSKRVDCSTEIRLLKQCQGHPNVVQLIDVLQVRISFEHVQGLNHVPTRIIEVW